MGLLSDISAAKMPEKKATDDVLLFMAIMNMIYSDGQMDESELLMLQNFFVSLPEFAGKDFNTIYTQALNLVKKHGGIQESTNALTALSSPELKKKAFVCAVDLALSSGDVGADEDALLEAMQRVLQIDMTFAKQTIEVLATKYAA